MAINKINRVVLSTDIKNELDNKATKAELENLKNTLENQINDVYFNIERKEHVATFNDLAIVYPNAKEGWTVTVDNTNITYQYDEDSESWIATSINALPKATNLIDGLMPKEYVAKIDTIEEGAEVNLTASETLELLKTVDGAGSGLDADTLQGKTPSDFATASHNHSSITGSASKLTTARTISLTGDVTGSVSFDGSANVSITTTVKDDSHNHSRVNGIKVSQGTTAPTTPTIGDIWIDTN